jgi:hypothetical protein
MRRFRADFQRNRTVDWDARAMIAIQLITVLGGMHGVDPTLVS